MRISTKSEWLAFGLALLLSAIAVPAFAHTQPARSAPNLHSPHFLQEQAHRYQGIFYVARGTKESKVIGFRSQSTRQLLIDLRDTTVLLCKNLSIGRARNVGLVFRCLLYIGRESLSPFD